jgi:hypothetical protein
VTGSAQPIPQWGQTADMAALAAQGDLAVLAWRDSTDDKIHLLRLDPGNGTPVGPAFRANDATSGTQGMPMLAMLDGGGFVLGWVGGGLRLQVFDAEGGRVGAERSVEANTVVARLLALPDGGFAALSAAHPGFHTGEVTLRIYDAAGNRQSLTRLFDGTDEGPIPLAAAVSGTGEIAVLAPQVRQKIG